MIAMTKTMTTEFITVYPPPPPTCNRLSAAQRANLRRSTKKVGKVLGASTLTTLDGNVSLPSTKPMKRRPSLLRIFSPSCPSTPPPSAEPAIVRFSDRPATPVAARPVPSSPDAESANKRAKLARLQRLLGNDVPVEMVFPTEQPPPVSRPATPTSLFKRRRDPPTEDGPHHASRKFWNIIRVSVPSLTADERRSVGLGTVVLDAVHEDEKEHEAEEESKEDYVLDEFSFLSLDKALRPISEGDEHSRHQVYSVCSLDKRRESTNWSVFADQLPSPTSSPLELEVEHSPLITARKDIAGTSTWFDATSPTLSHFPSPVSSRFSFHAERRPSSDSERSLRTPSPVMALSPSIVRDDDGFGSDALTEALFNAPRGKRWSEIVPRVLHSTS